MLEVAADTDVQNTLAGTGFFELGTTTLVSSIVCGQAVISLAEAERAWRSPLEHVFPTRTKDAGKLPGPVLYQQGVKHLRAPSGKQRANRPRKGLGWWLVDVEICAWRR